MSRDFPHLLRAAVGFAIVATASVGCCAKPTVANGPVVAGEAANNEAEESCAACAGSEGVRLQDHDLDDSTYVDPAGPEDGVGDSGTSGILADAVIMPMDRTPMDHTPMARTPMDREGTPRGVAGPDEVSAIDRSESSGVLEVLLAGVPLELMGGLDLGEVSLGYVDHPQAPYLQLDAELTGDRDPVTLLLPAARVEFVATESTSAKTAHAPVSGEVEAVPEESLGTSASGASFRRVTLRGDRGVLVRLDLPPQHQLRQVSATYYVFSVVVEMEHLDGRLDVLEVELDWDSWDIDATLAYRRLGPAWMGLFGRDTLSEEGPMEARLTKIENVDGRRVWVGALKSNPTSILRATP